MSFQKKIVDIFYTNVYWLLIGALVVLILFDYFGRTVRFYKRYAVKYDIGIPVFGSHYRRVFNIEPWRITLHKLYHKYADESFIGLHEIGGEPSYLIRDPVLVKRITIRDFNYFVDRYDEVNASTDPLIGHQLTNLRTENWRRIRALLTPMFTSQKFKQILIPSLTETRCELVDFLMERFDAEGSRCISVDMMELSTRSGIDGFCRSALGIKTDSLRRNDGGFYENGDAYVKHLNKLGGFEYFCLMALPRPMKYLFKSTLTQPKVDSFYRDTFAQIADTRITKNIQRNDYLRILQALRETTLTDDNGASEKVHSHTEAEAISQCFEFIESVITENNVIMNYVAQQLAANEHIQNRLFDEFTRIERKLNGAAIDYESLNEMKYMDMVTAEALRLCPIATELKRRATKCYTLEGSDGVKVPIKPGDAIWIPIYTIQTDDKYFPNAKHFDPERFNEENKSKQVGGSYAPFGMGPRDCIGCRYASFELKITFYYLCRKVKFCSRSETVAGDNLETKTILELRLR